MEPGAGPMRGETDAALVAAARGGEKAAFAALLVRHRPLLLALCRRALGDAALAEDAAQEAALQALLGLDRLRRPERFGPWLAGIGLNVCRRMLRRRQRDEWSWEALVGGAAMSEPVDPGPEPAAVAEEAELAAQVRAAVAALPRGQREAVALVYLAGLTRAEAAAQLGIEIGAVKTRLHKARSSLKRQLWAEWQGAEMAATVGTDAIDVEVVGVWRMKTENGEARSVAVLGETGGMRRLPIWMGDFEATAIALHLERTELPRPLTYAFVAKVVEAAGGRLREVRVARLEGEVFYATAVVDGPAGRAEIDARPSDALNLALLLGAPIRVAADVFDRVAEGPEDAKWTVPTAAGGEVEGTAQIAAAAVAEWLSRMPKPAGDEGEG